MRIGHLTLLHGYNYGGLLQAYATQKILKSHGHEVITVDYHPAKRMILLRQMTFNISVLHKPLGLWIDKKKFSGVSQFEKFRRQNFDFSPPSYNNHQLTKICREMDAVAVGSDQIWSSTWVKPPYFLDFDLEPNCKRLALSACCGYLNTEQQYLDYCTKTLGKFDAISVRNNFTAELVQRTTGEIPKVVCDPTLATDLPTTTVQGIASSYILIYVIKRPASLNLAQKVINYLKASNGIPVYSITPAELKGVETLTVDQTIQNISPFQWNYLIANASLVITDSFHGTIFSVKNHRKFLVLNSNLKKAGRFKSLLGDLGLERRIINGLNELNKLDELSEPNWVAVDQEITKMAQGYHDFVRDELSH